MFLVSCPSPEPEATGSLIITEVGNTYYGVGSSWIEVYNPSADDADLSLFKLRAHSILRFDPFDDMGIKSFSLPSIIVPPGAYAIVRGRALTDYWATSGRVAYIYDSGDDTVPFWTDKGFVELVHRNGTTADFVRFGDDTTLPATAGWSGGSASALPNEQEAYGQSIARDGNNTDTDTAVDWVLRSYSTPGGPNDIISETDLDEDGIPDANEQEGATYAGLPLYDWGARAGTPDIFVHIDYMDSTDPGVTPRKESLDKIVGVFQSHGFAIHFDVGDLFGTTTADHNLDGRSHRVPYKAGADLGFQDDSANLYVYKYRYMPLAKKQVFHYVLMAVSLIPDDEYGSSGLGEWPGNDFIVSLGRWGLSTETQFELNTLINYQASTIMHELGHNLGLGHGGGDSDNYKPNYYSIMNYMYQLEGLPPIGDEREGDRYYWFRYYWVDEGSDTSAFASYFSSGHDGLVNGPWTAEFVLDYSNGSGSQISESDVDETSGLGRTGSAGVDFNGNGDRTDSGFPFDLNSDSDLTQTHADYDDWSNIDLFFFRTWSGDSSGATVSSTFRLCADPVGDDRQNIHRETLTRPVRRNIKGK